MPMLLCPTIEHQPSTDPPITPASTVTVCPRATRPLLAPEARTRSWTFVGSLFVSSITSSSPTGTSTEAGSNRMPSSALTSTVVVLPVACTGPAP